MRGHFERALAAGQHGLRIASELGHRGWEVANRFTLGVVYGELFAPEQALQQLERALSLARELCSQYWVHHITGAMAGAYYVLDDLTAAQTCLETVLSPQTPMDTIGKRYCWARRAELTLAQGNPALALDIVDRLIASAPGMSPGRTITFLWKLKADALVATGDTERAFPLLHAAMENAQIVEERFLLWRVHASLGQVCCATDRPAEAEEAFSTAREIIQELGDTIPDETLRDNFVQGACGTFKKGEIRVNSV